MSFPDYSLRSEDHSSLLILVKQVGCHLKPKCFARIYERIQKVCQVHIHSQQRVIHLRYKKVYPLENNEWGDFQGHRKAIGLLCIGKCDDENEVEELFRLYEDLEQAYCHTLYDSRLILFGLNKDGTVLEQRLRRVSESDSGVSDKASTTSGGNDSNLTTPDDVENSNVTGSDDCRDGQIQSCVTPQGQTGSLTRVSQPMSDPLLNVASRVMNANQNLDDDLDDLYNPEESRDEELSSSAFDELPSAGSPCHVITSSQSQGRRARAALGLTNDGARSPAASMESNSNGSCVTSRDSGSSTSQPHVICYPRVETCPDLEEKLQDYVGSLFWILESKRLDRSYEKQDKPPLLTTPFEKKDLVGVDTDSRVYKKRCQGRLKKHLGDLCLLAGLPGEAMMHYQTSLDTFKSTNDWMWAGGAYEGLCSASILTTQPQVDKTSLLRNSSFSTKRGSSAMKEAKQRAGPFGRGLPNGLDLDDTRERTNVAIDDVIEKYREAIMHYSKFKNAGVVEMEASLKACHVAIDHQRFLAAADFLQNVVYIAVPLSEEEKTHRFSTLAVMYEKIGMIRKCAFFRRLAAMQSVSLTNPKPAWLQCYHLLLQTFHGYRLSLDPKEHRLGNAEQGWPLVQMRVLHELIYSARRMGNPAIAVRHLSYLLHTMFEHMLSQEVQELAAILESYTVRCEGTPQSLALENGTILPPVPFLKFPTVKSFRLLDSPPHLRPTRLKADAPSRDVKPASPGLFIYSPIQQRKVRAKPEFHWVVGDTCEVVLQVFNPLPFELKISTVGLLTEGCAFEVYPASLSLPAESGPYQVKVVGTPRESGDLTILGYTTRVMGVRSHCRLRDLPNVPEDFILLKVAPTLPKVTVTTSLPKAGAFSDLENSDIVVTSAYVSLYAGESAECQIHITNCSKLPVEDIHLSLESKTDYDMLKKVLTWTERNLTAQLPLLPGAQASLTVYVHSLSNFMADEQPAEATKGQNWYAPGASRDWDATATMVVEALLRIQYSGGPGLAEGFCRQCAVDMTLEILPSLLIHKWNLIPSDSIEHCHLVLDLENATDETLGVTSGDSHLQIPAGQCKRFPLRLPKCRYPPLVALTEVSLSSDSDDGFPFLPARDSGSPWWRQVQATVLQHISNFVDIRWTTPTESACGKLTLDNLLLTPEQLAILQLSDVRWEVSSGGHVVQSHDHVVECPCGEAVDIEWCLSNQSEKHLGAGSVRIKVYQDWLSGVEEETAPDAPDKVLIMGPSSWSVDAIPAGSQTSHNTVLMFLLAGTFKVEFSFEGQGHDLAPADHSPGSQEWHYSPAMTFTSSGVTSDPVT